MIGQIKSLFKHAEEYVDTNLELTKLKTVDTVSEMLSYVVTMMAIIGSVLLFIFMLLIAFSILIGHALGRTEYGFFIMAAAMGVFCIVLYAYKDSLLKNRLCDLLIKKILE